VNEAYGVLPGFAVPIMAVAAYTTPPQTPTDNRVSNTASGVAMPPAAAPAATKAGSSADYLTYFKLGVDVLAPFYKPTDLVRDAEIIRGKLRTALIVGKPPSVIAQLQAELASAERAAKISAQGEERTRQWSTLGQAAASVPVVIGIAVGVWIVAKAVKEIR
jgi:hypothetical protein